MADVSDPKIRELYEDVRDDNTETSWVKLVYSDGKTLVVDGSGSGGIEELNATFGDDECAYAYVRIITGDEESKRAKFVLVTWAGENAKPMQRAKMSVHKASVKEIWRDFAVELHGAEADDLKPETVLDIVVKAGGANYMGQGA